MKLKISVSKQLFTDLYVEVPDGTKPKDVTRSRYGSQLSEFAKEVNRSDWEEEESEFEIWSVEDAGEDGKAYSSDGTLDMNDRDDNPEV